MSVGVTTRVVRLPEWKDSVRRLMACFRVYHRRHKLGLVDAVWDGWFAAWNRRARVLQDVTVCVDLERRRSPANLN